MKKCKNARDCSEKKRKDAKLGHTGSRGGHVTHLWIFGTPDISGINEARNFKFDTEMEGSEY